MTDPAQACPSPEQMERARVIFAAQGEWGPGSPFWDDMRKGLALGAFDDDDVLQAALAAIIQSDHQQAELLARAEAMAGALEPFAKAADVRLCAGDGYWTDEKTIQGTDVAFHVTFGGLRQARTAYREYQKGRSDA